MVPSDCIKYVLFGFSYRGLLAVLTVYLILALLQAYFKLLSIIKAAVRTSWKANNERLRTRSLSIDWTCLCDSRSNASVIISGGNITPTNTFGPNLVARWGWSMERRIGWGGRHLTHKSAEQRCLGLFAWQHQLLITHLAATHYQFVDEGLCH